MASVASLLGNQYEPTAIFSFEFFKRNPVTKMPDPNQRLGEIFFLLPPESYSLSEGYKISITKTAGGAWIDDFGNDFKKLRLSGSLYSYYQGYPPDSAPSNSQGEKNIFKRAGKKLLDAGKSALSGAVQSAQALGGSIANEFGVDVPGLKGLSGLEELFRLRYVLSRFRDAWISGDKDKTFTPRYKGTAKEEVVTNLESLQKNGGGFSNNVAIIYHDYDEDNHYDVIFDNFTISRDKSDPFTANYSIELTAIREFFFAFVNVGVLSQKVSPYQAVAQVLQTFDNALSAVRALVNIPKEIAKKVVDLLAIGDEIKRKVNAFSTGVTSDWKSFTSFLKNFNIESKKTLDDLLVFAYGQNALDTKNELLRPSEKNNASISAFQSLSHGGSGLRGTGAFFSDSAPNGNRSSDENKTITDDSFNTSVDPSPDKIYSEQNSSLYVVKQGDTAQGIALNFYGDAGKASIILEINGLFNYQFQDGSLVGMSIIIPGISSGVGVPNNKNLVYYERVNGMTPEEQTNQMLGTDFSLDENRGFESDGTGDLGMVFGQDCFYENLQDRLNFEYGTLAPFDPGWGTLAEAGQPPFKAGLLKIIDSIEEQINRDPRTKSAFVDRNNVLIEGDKVLIQIYITPISGTQQIFSKTIGG